MGALKARRSHPTEWMTMRPTMTMRVSGVALATAPLLAYTVVSASAISRADTEAPCASTPPTDSAPPGAPCGDQPQGQALSCPDGMVTDPKSRKCISDRVGVAEELKALPALPGSTGTGGIGDIDKIPALGTVNLPSVVLPKLDLDLVPNVNVNLEPKF